MKNLWISKNPVIKVKKKLNKEESHEQIVPAESEESESPRNQKTPKKKSGRKSKKDDIENKSKDESEEKSVDLKDSEENIKMDENLIDENDDLIEEINGENVREISSILEEDIDDDLNENVHENGVVEEAEIFDEKTVLFRKAFDIYDRKSEKLISEKDLITALRAVGNNPSEKDVVFILESLPSPKEDGGEKKIDFDTFMNLANRYSHEVDVTVTEIQSIFNLFDKENTGKIHITLLGQILMNLGDKMSEEDFENMVKEIIEVDEQGNVFYVEFIEKILNVKEEVVV